MFAGFQAVLHEWHGTVNNLPGRRARLDKPLISSDLNRVDDRLRNTKDRCRMICPVLTQLLCSMQAPSGPMHTWPALKLSKNGDAGFAAIGLRSRTVSAALAPN